MIALYFSRQAKRKGGKAVHLHAWARTQHIHALLHVFLPIEWLVLYFIIITLETVSILISSQQFIFF